MHGVNSSKRILEHATALVGSDKHARVVVSKFYEVTNMQKKKTPAHFSRVSFGEMERPSIFFKRLKCVCISEVYKTLPPVRTKNGTNFLLG